jgi:hypothetical protein
MGRSRGGRRQWLAWVSEQAECGLSVKQFCDERQISLQSFYLWRRKVRGVENASTGGLHRWRFPSGLTENEKVVLCPTDQIQEGVRVASANAGL